MAAAAGAARPAGAVRKSPLAPAGLGGASFGGGHGRSAVALGRGGSGSFGASGSGAAGGGGGRGVGGAAGGVAGGGGVSRIVGGGTSGGGMSGGFLRASAPATRHVFPSFSGWSPGAGGVAAAAPPAVARAGSVGFGAAAAGGATPAAGGGAGGASGPSRSHPAGAPAAPPAGTPADAPAGRPGAFSAAFSAANRSFGAGKSFGASGGFGGGGASGGLGGLGGGDSFGAFPLPAYSPAATCAGPAQETPLLSSKKFSSRETAANGSSGYSSVESSSRGASGENAYPPKEERAAGGGGGALRSGGALPATARLLAPPHVSLSRRPRRKAVCVGVNYVLAPDIALKGACNDAAAFALSLINQQDYRPEDIILLVDAYPAQCYRNPAFWGPERSGRLVQWRDRQPTRRNILLALNWLKADTAAGDVLTFFFAGHGVQVDDLSGWEGEGYDESILPMDFFDGREVNAITALMLKNLLLSALAPHTHLCIVLDCAGGQTALDPVGTEAGGWHFIKGVKQKGIWPFVTDPTNKVARATYKAAAWTDEAMRARGARPRFIPGVEVSSTQDLLDPSLQARSGQQLHTQALKGFLFTAAEWGQAAVEAKMPALVLNSVTAKGRVLPPGQRAAPQPPGAARGVFVHHGVFTWCFLSAVAKLIAKQCEAGAGMPGPPARFRGKRVPYKALAAEVNVFLAACAAKGLPKLTQKPQLTLWRCGGSDSNDLFLWPYGGDFAREVPYSGFDPLPPLPCVPHETGYLSPWQAEELLFKLGQETRQKDPVLRRSITAQHAMTKRPPAAAVPPQPQSGSFPPPPAEAAAALHRGWQLPLAPAPQPLPPPLQA